MEPFKTTINIFLHPKECFGENNHISFEEKTQFFFSGPKPKVMAHQFVAFQGLLKANIGILSHLLQARRYLLNDTIGTNGSLF